MIHCATVVSVKQQYTLAYSHLCVSAQSCTLAADESQFSVNFSEYKKTKQNLKVFTISLVT